MRLLVLSAFPREGRAVGGVATAAHHLVQSLALHSQMEEIIVITFDPMVNGCEKILIPHGKIRVCSLPAQKRWALLVRRWPDYLRLRRLIRAQGWRPDIIHGQGCAGDGFLAVRLGQFLEIPAVVTVHGMWDSETRLSKGQLRAFLADSMMQWTLRRADGVIFVSPHRMDELEELIRGQAFLIENGVADEFFRPGSEIHPRCDATVLYAGVIRPLKRITDLIRAFGKVSEAVPAAQLRLVGPSVDMAYSTELDRLVAELGLQSRVTFAGPLPQNQLWREYLRASVCVLASQQENAPQVLAEAMAAGLPVVATNVGGIPWMVQDGENGYLVRVGDVEGLSRHMIELLTNQTRWEAFSSRARASAERFRARGVAARTLDAYHQVVQRARPAGANV